MSSIYDLKNIQDPTLVLAKRNCDKLGIINTAANITVKKNMSAADELSFTVYKTDNVNLWNDIKSFKLLWVKELDMWFEIYVQTTDSNSTTKEVTGTAICEAELSQISLYNVEINTEDDIARDDYKVTVLYNSLDPEASLLNRILEKAPHYSIDHVDSTIANIQRSFSFDSKTIYDALQEIAEEISCLFVFGNESNEDGTVKRTISAYDLLTACVSTTCDYYKTHSKKYYRGDFEDTCPYCGGTNLHAKYGKVTGVFVSGDNLASEVKKEADTDSMKNCFRLSGGDDLMTATIINCNPNGTQYLWRISDETKEDMSTELKTAINNYDSMYDAYDKTKTITIGSVISDYNTLVVKYNEMMSQNRDQLTSVVVGYPNLMVAYYDTIDFNYFLQTELMPEVVIVQRTAAEEAENLVTVLGEEYKDAIALSSVTENTSSSTFESSLNMVLKTIVNTSLFTFTINTKTFTPTTGSATWTGTVTLTAIAESSDGTHDEATTSSITISVNTDYESYLKQLITKQVNSNDTDDVSMSGIFKKDDDAFATELTKYSLDCLNSIYSCAQGVLEVLIDQGCGKKKSDGYSVYSKYKIRQKMVSNEIEARNEEINSILAVKTRIDTLRNLIGTELNFQTYITKNCGSEYWDEFCMFRREDEYKNDNYISDGLSNADLVANAIEFLEVAKKELKISSTLQHTITATMSNLFTIEEFKSLWDSFDVGNWIHVEIDGEIYKLRLTSYEIQFDQLQDISVEFSDVELYDAGSSDLNSLMSNLSSMSTSYDSVKHQSTINTKSTKVVNDWVQNGMDITNSKIATENDNQQQTWDEHGILLKKNNPILEGYEDAQMRLVNRGIYITDDNWESVSAAIGNYYYTDPITGELTSTYGVIADTLVGKLILGEALSISNSSGTMTFDDSGFRISSDALEVGDDQSEEYLSLKNYVSNKQVSSIIPMWCVTLSDTVVPDKDEAGIWDDEQPVEVGEDEYIWMMNEIYFVGSDDPVRTEPVYIGTTTAAYKASVANTTAIAALQKTVEDNAWINQHMTYGDDGTGTNVLRIYGEKNSKEEIIGFSTNIRPNRLSFQVGSNDDIAYILTNEDEDGFFYIQNGQFTDTLKIGAYDGDYIFGFTPSVDGHLIFGKVK